MISIVIPLYNKEKEIARTLRSALNQTFHDFEIVVINDGSTDNSVTELEKINDPRIRLFHQTNAGVSATRNRGIYEARWNLIAFLDADDEWKPEYLQTQYELFLKYPECSVFACNYEFRNSCGEITPTTIRRLPFSEQDGILTNYFEVASYSHPPICSISIMVKKEAIQSISAFPLGIKSGEDLLTWARLACQYKIAYTRRILAIFYIEGYGISEQPKRMPQFPDIVGEELHLLSEKHIDLKGIKSYCGLWHKMRASIFLRLKNKTMCRTEIWCSFSYSFRCKLIAYYIISFFK